jgi:hypothetical protein
MTTLSLGDTSHPIPLPPSPPPPPPPPPPLPPPENEGFLTVDDSAIDCFASTADEGSIGSAADDAGGRRPLSVLDLNKPCPSEFPDGAPSTSRVPDLEPVDDDHAADVDERPAVAVVVQRHQPGHCSSTSSAALPRCLSAGRPDDR